MSRTLRFRRGGPVYWACTLGSPRGLRVSTVWLRLLVLRQRVVWHGFPTPGAHEIEAPA